ncbi:hypothetical protein ACOSQ4_023965 [Xanthoceras sorbifolium]
MSTEESSRSGYTVIWLISCFLFISIAAGGGFLVMYMVLPESPSTSWLPLAGVTLVCLPWLFWFLTFFYRVVSRACGFRMVIGGVGVGVGDGGGGKGGDNANAGNSTREDLLSNDSMTTGGGGGEGMVGNDHDDVVTPAVVVLSDQKDHNRSSSSGSHERKESSNDDIKQNCSSSSDSIASRESEVPLAYSMS